MTQELKPCPFCGCSIRLESNHDWHRLQGEHDDACPFSNRDETLMAAATDSQLALLFHDWNRRHDAQQPEAVPSEQARWCAYVGGMVAHWVKSEPDAPARLSDDEFEAAIAGIIERRLWALRREPAQQPAGDVVRDAERYRWMAAHCRSIGEHWGGRWSIVIDGPVPKTHDSEDDFDAAIDAALASSARKAGGE